MMLVLTCGACDVEICDCLLQKPIGEVVTKPAAVYVVMQCIPIQCSSVMFKSVS